MVKLTEEEKRGMSIELASHLPRIRSLLSVTQAELGSMCGFSRNRISQIESGAIVMTWSQLTSIVLVTMVNQRTKEYFFANQVLSPRFLQFLQRKDENIPPDTNIVVSDKLTESFKQGKIYAYDPSIYK